MIRKVMKLFNKGSYLRTYRNWINELNSKNGRRKLNKFRRFSLRYKPRTKPKVYTPDAVVLKRIWSIPISLFKDYKSDNEYILNKCFELDWSCTRITRLIKDPNEQQQCKELLKSNYK